MPLDAVPSITSLTNHSQTHLLIKVNLLVLVSSLFTDNFVSLNFELELYPVPQLSSAIICFLFSVGSPSDHLRFLVFVWKGYLRYLLLG